MDTKTKLKWKKESRLDNVLNVLLIVLALGVLGVSAIEVQIDSGSVVASAGA